MGSSKLANKNIMGGSHDDYVALTFFFPFIYGALILLVIISLPILIIYLRRLFKWLFSKQYTDTITVKNKRVKDNLLSATDYLIDGSDKNVYVTSKFNYERININDTFTATIDDRGEDLLYIRKIINFMK